MARDCFGGIVAAVTLALSLLAPAVAAGADTRPRFVVAVLGDSYASGEGAPDVPGRHSDRGLLVGPECFDPCFSETWWNPDAWFPGRDAVFPQQDDPGWQADARRCHRSSKATGPHAAMLLADRFSDLRVEVLDFACGGAKIFEGVLKGWLGPEPPVPAPPFLPSQLEALEDYVRATNRTVDAVVINIGGNDTLFDQLVTECVVLQALDADCSDDAVVATAIARTVDQQTLTGPLSLASLDVRYRALDASFRGAAFTPDEGFSRLRDARPQEIYLTGAPSAFRDAPPVDDPAGNPADICDGTQTADDFYKNLSRVEAVALEGFVTGLNGAMDRAATRHGWTFMPQMFASWRDHGICADGASFFRTNRDALRIQGIEGLPPLVLAVPISPGIAHPNDAGYADRAAIVADVVEEQIKLRTRAPTLFVQGVTPPDAFRVRWQDPSPAHVPETAWEMELAEAGGPVSTIEAEVGTGAGDIDQTSVDPPRLSWRVVRRGEYTVRVRGCRDTPTAAEYCGPFSNARTIATQAPGRPVDLRRVQAVPPSPSALRIAWTPGPNTPQSVRYEVRHGPRTTITIPCPPGAPRGRVCTANGFELSEEAGTTGTVVQVGGLEPGEHAFEVRACSSAGCSPFSGVLVATLSGIEGPVTPGLVGTVTVDLPRRVRAGRPALALLAWTTPRRWTDIDRIDLTLTLGRRALGRIRFVQEDGTLRAVRRGRRRTGTPGEERRLRLGPLALDLARSAVVRFGPAARRVELRLALVPGRALRGRAVELGVAARDDRGRRQRQRVAGDLVVR